MRLHILYKLSLVFLVFLIATIILSQGHLVYAVGTKLPPTFQDAEALFIKALALLWAVFVLDTLRFIIYYGGKYVFMWAGAIDSNTNLFQEIKDKSTRIIISVIGVLGMPYFISLFMGILFAGAAPGPCYSFLQNSAGFLTPVFQLVVPGC